MEQDPVRERRSRLQTYQASADGIAPASILNIIGGLFGLTLVCFGGFGAVRLFFAVLDFIKKPDAYYEIVGSWSKVLGVTDLTIPVKGIEFPAAGPLAVLFLFIGSLVLVKLLGSILKTGLVLLSWSRGDKKPAKPVAEVAEVASE